MINPVGPFHTPPCSEYICPDLHHSPPWIPLAFRRMLTSLTILTTSIIYRRALHLRSPWRCQGSRDSQPFPPPAGIQVLFMFTPVFSLIHYADLYYLFASNSFISQCVVYIFLAYFLHHNLNFGAHVHIWCFAIHSGGSELDEPSKKAEQRFEKQ